MSPYIDTLIMYHKQAFQNFSRSIEVDPIPISDIMIINHKLCNPKIRRTHTLIIQSIKVIARAMINKKMIAVIRMRVLRLQPQTTPFRVLESLLE